MLGDAFSDTYANLKEAVGKHYADEFTNLPKSLQQQVATVLDTIDSTREAIDHYQAGLCTCGRGDGYWRTHSTDCPVWIVAWEERGGHS